VIEVWRRVARVISGLSLVLVLTTLGVSFTGAQATPKPQTEMQYRPLLVSVPTPPRGFMSYAAPGTWQPRNTASGRPLPPVE
jgi:hypothetical protein